MTTPDQFPCGLRVFLRSTNAEGLHYNTHLDGRNILIEKRIINILGPERLFLGTYLLDAVSMILPLETVGPTP